MKRTSEQLKSMAKRVLVAKAEGDERYLQFCFQMMVNTGLSMEVVEANIAQLARDGTI